MKIAIVLGTRPEIIKMSPIIRECERRALNYFVLHTGQHYSYEMDSIFFEELELPKPKHNLGVGSGSHGEETGRMLIAVERALLEEKPDIVLVEGDTNSVLAGALAAAKVGIKVGHVEAGMRSYDRSMPEEINRILTDHISDHLFAATHNARKTLLREGIPDNRVFVTGSTVVEAMSQCLEITSGKVGYEPDPSPSAYFLLTLHRQENVDIHERLANILSGLGMLCQELDLPVLWPAHPRTRRNLERFGLSVPSGVKLTKPVGFFEFLRLERNARLILTDSGGVQMEACILRIPCVTLRHSTEWVETLEIGANILAGCEPDDMLRSVKEMLNRDTYWSNPFGDGTAAKQTIDIITER
jgi:UDP-N-acetylglucosamine 2-epimerase (non-hydrolysing)